MQVIKTLIEEAKEELVDYDRRFKTKRNCSPKGVSTDQSAKCINDRVVKKNRDFSMGLPTDTTHKAKTASADCPDVVLLPPHRRGRKENVPF